VVVELKYKKEELNIRFDSVVHLVALGVGSE
jgi:hypothetical protein